MKVNSIVLLQQILSSRYGIVVLAENPKPLPVRPCLSSHLKCLAPYFVASIVFQQVPTQIVVLTYKHNDFLQKLMKICFGYNIVAVYYVIKNTNSLRTKKL